MRKHGFWTSMTIVLLMWLAIGFASAAPAAERNVLILHSYTAQNQWTADQEAGFLENLELDKDADYVDVVYLDAKQYNSPEYFDAITNFLNGKYAGRRFDLVYATDDHAMNFLLTHELSFLESDTPIVYSGVNYAEDIKGDKTTGVMERLDHRGMFTLIDELYDGRKPVLLVGDESLTNERIQRNVEEILAVEQYDLDISFLLTDDLNDLIRQVESLTEPVLVMLVFNQDQAGGYYSYQQSFDLLYEASNVPIFSYWDFYLPRGATGGMMLGGRENGAAAAELAGLIFAGADPDSLPIGGVPSASYMNYSEVLRFGLSPERIESLAFEWYDRPTSFIRENWRILLATTGIILFLLSIIILLVLNINKRREYALTVERQKEDLDALNSSLEEKVKERTEQLRVSLEETRRMQHEIIQSKKLASLGHLVAGISHEVSTPLGLGMTLASYQSQLLDRLQGAYGEGKMSRGTLEDYFAESRETSDQLVDNLAKAADLMSSFKSISVDRISENKRTIEVKGYLQDVVTSLTPEYKRMDVAFEIEGDEVSMVTYPGLIGQIVTNLIMNALRHGFHGRRQGKIRMEITDEGEELRIRFHDDGHGIPPEHRERIFDPFFTTKLGSGGSGLGLSIVYNAVVQKLKGWIRLVQADAGTTFDIMIPKGDASDA